MVKYLFNGKVQVFTHKFFSLGYHGNLKEELGEEDAYNNELGLGYLYICW